MQIHFLRPMPISLDYDFPGKEGMIHLVAINYILTLGLIGILTRDTIQENLFGDHTILRGKSIAVERSCKFRHSSVQLAREPTNRSLMFLRSRGKRM